MNFSPATLLEALQRLPRCRRYLVAYSGGLDSHVLLHALAALRPRLDGTALAAVHVDHGLQPSAKHWSEHCVAVCRQLDIPIRVVRVDARPGPGESPEAAARAARYRALQELMEKDDCLLTAQHQDDQAETFLLQLLRGAGPRGAAGMPRLAPFGPGWIARPLLAFPRAALRRYAEAQGLQWVDDPTNFDTVYDRNFLRHEILPRLARRWPAVARTLARAAEHQAEAFRVMESVAREDLERVRGAREGTLSVRELLRLDDVRRRGVLRLWVRERGLPIPSQAHLLQVTSSVLSAAEDATPCVRWSGAEVRRYRDGLYALLAPLPPHSAATVLHWTVNAPLELPEGVGGRLVARETLGAGLRLTTLQGESVTVRFRRGGEKCQPAGRRETHTLKKLLQEAAIPPWERDRIPLIYVGDRLAAVAGLWICEPFRAGPEEHGLIIEWQRDAG